MTPFVRSLGIAAAFVLLSSPPRLQHWIGGDTRAYVVATVALAVLVAVLTFAADANERDTRRSDRTVPAVVAGVLASALIVVTCRGWLDAILAVPVDPYRGDMLVVVREGLRRLSTGQNPYTVYHVPWAAPLAYGPLLWAPYAIPMLLKLDLRFLTVAGELFVPVACAVVAVVSARRGRVLYAVGALVLLAAIGLNPDLARFTVVGHTPVYWPLLALFAWLVARERWSAAALCLGLLVVARSTMVAVVPVLLMTAWLRDRRAFARILLLTAAPVVLTLLPFAVWDLNALTYALYGSYEKVIKEVVWPDPTVPHTIGLTGVLLTHHWQRWVEAVQLAVLLLVYVACWFGLRARRAPVRLMTFALLAFSMTTLWPVTYIYFDVLLLLTASVLADMSPAPARWLPRWSALYAASAAVVAALAWMTLPAEVVTSPVRWRDAPRAASVVCVRRTSSSAAVAVQTGAAPAGTPQAMSVSLNGVALGTIDLSPAGDLVTLPAPARLWHVGANNLEFAVAAPVAIGDVVVRPR